MFPNVLVHKEGREEGGGRVVGVGREREGRGGGKRGKGGKRQWRIRASACSLLQVFSYHVV